MDQAASNSYQLRCTYRLQLRPGFGFADAAEIADYLQALGVSHVYCSPYLQAAPGSTHGYDVLDHHSVNAELGGTMGHEAFCAKLGENGLGQVLDVVPNHMSIARHENRWWWDVLENGPASHFASYFDVDWLPLEAKLHNLVSMPILGDHYGRVLEAGEIRLERDGGSFHMRYHDHVLPLAPRSLDSILQQAAEHCRSDLLTFAADLAAELPLASLTDRASVFRRHRDKEILRRMLEQEFREQPESAEAVDRALADVNNSPDQLDALLSRQNYRLSFWRTAKQDLDYRRFFDINTLVGLRVEEEQVFRDTHALVVHWLERGVLDGLRIDHPDGLRNPQQYFHRLRTAAPNAWIVAEKILMPSETLPETWPIDGTTGYDFLNAVQGLFADPRGESLLTEFYAEFTGESTDYARTVREKKLQVMHELFASDINRLTVQLADVCERHRRYRDYTRRDLNAMLREVIANMPVYRTYVQTDPPQVNENDRNYLDQAIAAAKVCRPELDTDLFDFFHRILLLEIRGELESELVMRFQQCTGAIMAKGVEDTQFYNFNRLVALNEVGSDPLRFGVSSEQFHEHNLRTAAQHPRTMLSTATHDTKRGEDARLRLLLLTENPERWAAAVRRWSAMNERHRTQFQPDRNAEYLYYQTLVAAWPLDFERAWTYFEKAAREAKQQTSWNAPNEKYEQALRTFLDCTMKSADFLESISQFVSELLQPARTSSLAQLLLKLTSPGVPDVYQGCELWELSMVDPDNRRPVDYALRRRLLKEMEMLSPEQILRRSDEGLPKLWTLKQTLALRRRRPELFDAATYAPLIAEGAKAQHVVAFLRGEAVATVVPRLVVGRGNDWGDTSLVLSDGTWLNEMTGEKHAGGRMRLAQLLRSFPVALLSHDDAS